MAAFEDCACLPCRFPMPFFDDVISDPWFYTVAIPAVLLMGISKSGFGSGFGSLAVPIMALAISVPKAAAIFMPILLVMDLMGLVGFSTPSRRFPDAILAAARIAGYGRRNVDFPVFTNDCGVGPGWRFNVVVSVTA